MADVHRWFNVNHTTRAITSAMALTAFSINAWTLLPFFIYGGWFNQFINVQRDLPFFYIGKTAWVDRMARKYLGEKAGVIIFILCNSAALITIIL